MASELCVDLKSLGGQTVPPASDKKIFYIVLGTFAKSEQEYDSDHGQQLLRMVSFKELLNNVSDEDVKKLSSYEKGGIELHRAARKRLLEEISAEDDVSMRRARGCPGGRVGRASGRGPMCV